MKLLILVLIGILIFSIQVSAGNCANNPTDFVFCDNTTRANNATSLGRSQQPNQYWGQQGAPDLIWNTVRTPSNTDRMKLNFSDDSSAYNYTCEFYGNVTGTSEPNVIVTHNQNESISTGGSTNACIYIKCSGGNWGTYHNYESPTWKGGLASCPANTVYHFKVFTFLNVTDGNRWHNQFIINSVDVGAYRCGF